MPLELIVVTPEGQAYSGPVDHVVLPGSEGDFGVLEQHERYLAPLRCGPMEIKIGGSSTWAAVSDGFADVSAEQVVVLVDRCLTADVIDVAAAKAKHEELSVELERLSFQDNDQARRADLAAELALADASIEVHGRK